MAESSVKYYKLGNASAFWDGGQSDPESRKIAPGEVKPLEYNPKVKRLLGGGAIEIASEAEYKEFLKKKAEWSKAGKKKGVADTKELAKLKKDLSASVSENSKLQEENATLLEKIAELESTSEDKK